MHVFRSHFKSQIILKSCPCLLCLFPEDTEIAEMNVSGSLLFLVFLEEVLEVLKVLFLADDVDPVSQFIPLLVANH